MGESFSTAQRGAFPRKGLIPAIFRPGDAKMESSYRDAPISVDAARFCKPVRDDLPEFECSW